MQAVSPGIISAQTIRVTVTNVNEAPVITSPSTASVAENTRVVHTLTATDADMPAQTIAFSIAGSGADNGLFEIVGGNQLHFRAAPDFENPTDTGGTAADNVYEVSVQADDAGGGVTPQTILVTVTDVNEAPMFTSPEAASVAENTQTVHTLSATDPDLPAETLTFGIEGGGADDFAFEIVGGNQLQFRTAPDFENPTDSGGTPADNVYEVTVTVSDGPLNLITQTIQVMVTNVAEPMTFVVDTTVDENDGDFSVGDLSLREAIGLANANLGADTISFDASVFTGGTASLIRLQSGQLFVSEAVHIDGGSQAVVISGDASGDDTLLPGTFITDIAASNTAGTLADNNGRIFDVVTSVGSEVRFTGLTITGGDSTTGAGIKGNSSRIVVEQSTIAGNRATLEGGGINTGSGVVSLTGSTVSGNQTSGGGGGILTESGAITLTRSTVSGNSSARGGGISTRGALQLRSSTVFGNNATYIGGGIRQYTGSITIENSDHRRQYSYHGTRPYIRRQRAVDQLQPDRRQHGHLAGRRPHNRCQWQPDRQRYAQRYY